MPSPTQKSVLLLVDIQEGFNPPTHLHWGPSRSNPSFETNTTILLATYRRLLASHPHTHKIIHIAHSSLSPLSPLTPTSPGFAFQALATPRPGELVITKHVNSAFIGTNLEGVLKEHFGGEPGTLYVIGMTTDHCVSTTVRMAGNLGVCDAGDGSGRRGEVVLVGDATAAHQKEEGGFEAEIVHGVHVESLREFAEVVETVELVKLWGVWIGF